MKKLFIVGLIIGIWAMGNTPIEASSDGTCLRHAPIRAIMAGRVILRKAVQRIESVKERIVQQIDEVRDTICNINIVIQNRLKKSAAVGRQIIYRVGQRAIRRPLLRSIFSCQ